MSLTVSLPRDALSVPLVRRIAAQTLGAVGFHADDVLDVEIALSEACGNVLRHSASGHEYEVRTTLEDAVLVIEVLDTGVPFDGVDLGRGEADPEAETGRGVLLMRALVDDLRFEYTPGRGNTVSMTKHLRYDPASPLSRLRRGARADI